MFLPHFHPDLFQVHNFNFCIVEGPSVGFLSQVLNLSQYFSIIAWYSLHLIYPQPCTTFTFQKMNEDVILFSSLKLKHSVTSTRNVRFMSLLSYIPALLFLESIDLPVKHLFSPLTKSAVAASILIQAAVISFHLSSFLTVHLSKCHLVGVLTRVSYYLTQKLKTQWHLMQLDECQPFATAFKSLHWKKFT